MNERIFEKIREEYGRTATIERKNEWMDWVYLGEEGTTGRRRVWVREENGKVIAKFEEYGITPEETYEREVTPKNIDDIIKEIKEFLS